MVTKRFFLKALAAVLAAPALIAKAFTPTITPPPKCRCCNLVVKGIAYRQAKITRDRTSGEFTTDRIEEYCVECWPHREVVDAKQMTCVPTQQVILVCLQAQEMEPTEQGDFREWTPRKLLWCSPALSPAVSGLFSTEVPSAIAAHAEAYALNNLSIRAVVVKHWRGTRWALTPDTE